MVLHPFSISGMFSSFYLTKKFTFQPLDTDSPRSWWERLFLGYRERGLLTVRDYAQLYVNWTFCSLQARPQAWTFSSVCSGVNGVTTEGKTPLLTLKISSPLAALQTNEGLH